MELSSYANYELGEAFFEIISMMLIKDGVPLPRLEAYDFLSPKWRKLVNKENKTPADIEKIDKDYKEEIIDIADSYAIYLAAKTGNQTYRFTFEDYKKYMQISNLMPMPSDKAELEQYKKRLENRFRHIANHGENTGDNIIDNRDIAAYIYALDMKSERDDKNNFTGFYLNGKIAPLDYAVAFKMLQEDGESMFTFKLRHAYKNLFE